jgi:TPP-dependent pyruvate/acetoin dehydrogenase alpha subunit
MHLPAPDALDTLRQLYRCMSRIRAFEDAAEIVSQGGVSAYNKTADGSAKVRGPLHLSTGQEAVAAGVCAHLQPSDLLTSTHRGHGHTLAKGADLAGMMCELYGKASGFNGGKGGSMRKSCGDKAPSRSAFLATARSTAGPSWSHSTGPASTSCRCCLSAKTTAGAPPPPARP